MEQKPNEKGLVNPEIREKIEDKESHKKEIQKYIKQSLESVKFFVDSLEFNQDYLKFQEESKSEFSKEEIEKFRKEIEEDKKFIQGIRDTIDTLILEKISIEADVDELNNLEKRFKAILLKIRPENLQ